MTHTDEGIEVCGCGVNFEEEGIEIVYYRGEPMCPECYEDSRVADIDAMRDMQEEGYLIDGVGFADPGGNSALRAETPDNPRNLPCPNCKRENMLTPLDRARGYQCDICADEAERGY